VTRKRTVVLTAGLTLGLLAPAAPATASTTPVNLIKDSGAESAKQADVSGVAVVPVAHWTPITGTGFTAVKYGSPEFITKTGPGPKSRGHNFFSGGERGPSPAGATQVDSLKTYVSLIAAGNAKFTLSGWFGGFADQRDYATLTVVWENAAGVAVGTPKAIGDVTPGQRKDVTGLLARSANGTVPKAATQALLRLKMVRLDGGYDDGYADNLSLVITKASA
jgi:hypothetical protein